MTDTKEQAEALRRQGNTYKEISQLLNGAVSVDWCKRNLKHITKLEQKDECIDKLIELATRPEGVSVYEANGVIMQYNKDKHLSKDQIRYIRNKAKARNNNCLFRPDWVSSEKPTDSYKAFCAYVLHMQDEIDNLIRHYCDSFPDTKPSSVKYELLSYLRPDKNSISLSKRISKAEKLTEQMQDRTNISP